MRLIIDIPEVVQHKVYAYGLSLSPSDKEQLIKAILTGTSISDNATNGDVIKAMFSHYDIEIDEHKGYVRVFYEDFYTTYPMRWWNAPYQKGGKE